MALERFARPAITESMSDGNERMVILGLATIRLAQYLPGVAVVAFVSGADGGVRALAWLIAAVAGAVGVFADGLRRGRLEPRWILVDIVVASVVAVAVGTSVSPEVAVSWINWSFVPLMGAATTAAVGLTRRWALVTTLVCLAAYVGSVAPWRGGIAVAVDSIGNAVSIVAFAIVAAIFADALRRNAYRAQAAMETASALEIERMTEHARTTERLHQHQMLHDTALATLTGIAAGTLDASDPRTRDRCAQDAALVRNLILSEGDPAPTNLAWAVGEAVRRHAGAIREIHHQSDVTTNELPAEVVAAFARATTEALNNVERHAGTSSVWVTVTGDQHQANVSIVDRGVGFDHKAVHEGLGLKESVMRRLWDVGGEARVDSAAGAGTTVELSWPRP
jgi:signal transduction histidine kinase